MTITETPLHDPADPARASAYCRHCRDEKAAGLRSYGDWRARLRFSPHLDQPQPVAEAKAHIRRVKAGVWDGRTHYADTWVWWIHEDGPTYFGGPQLAYGYAPTWATAMAQAEAALLAERTGSGLVAA